MRVMVKNRLKAPPPEVYSLHRKLSGSYLMNMNLRSKVHSRKIFMDIYKRAHKRHDFLNTPDASEMEKLI